MIPFSTSMKNYPMNNRGKVCYVKLSRINFSISNSQLNAGNMVHVVYENIVILFHGILDTWGKITLYHRHHYDGNIHWFYCNLYRSNNSQDKWPVMEIAAMAIEDLEEYIGQSASEFTYDIL